MSMSVAYTMVCPECDGPEVEVEGTYTESYGSENFWGAQVSTDDSEFEVDRIEPCSECGQVTVSRERASEFFWDQVAGDYE